MTKALLSIHKSDGRISLNGNYYSVQCGQNDCDHMKNTGTGLFIIVNVGEPSDFGVADSFDKNVDMLTEEKQMTSNLMELKSITPCTVTLRWTWVAPTFWYGFKWYSGHPILYLPFAPELLAYRCRFISL